MHADAESSTSTPYNDFLCGLQISSFMIHVSHGMRHSSVLRHSDHLVNPTVHVQNGLITRIIPLGLACLLCCVVSLGVVRAEGEGEVTARVRRRLRGGLEWLAKNQGPDGNWNSNDLGLGQSGCVGVHGCRTRAGSRSIRRAKCSAHSTHRDPQCQAVGTAEYLQCPARHVQPRTVDPGAGPGARHDDVPVISGLNATLDHALRLIRQHQCDDGGWDYQARSRPRGHDLSLAVMQAKALAQRDGQRAGRADGR